MARQTKAAGHVAGDGTVVVDTSAWVAYLRADESAADHALTWLADHEPDRVLVCDPVAMEVLAGARSPRHLRDLRRMLHEFTSVATIGFDDFDAAAGVYRQCRAQGITPRNLVDCLVAAIALRTGSIVLHADRDFDAIARGTDLRTHPPAARR
ncbi:MAG: PIN domain nuclease [Acidimicrobiales bacterium]